MNITKCINRLIMKTRLLKKLRREAYCRYYTVALSNHGPYEIHRHYGDVDDYIRMEYTKEEAIRAVREHQRAFILNKVIDMRRSKAKRIDY